MEAKPEWVTASSEVQEAAKKIVQQEEQARYEEDEVDVLRSYQLAEEALLVLDNEQPTIPGSSNSIVSPDCGLGGSGATAGEKERERYDGEGGPEAEGAQEGISKEAQKSGDEESSDEGSRDEERSDEGSGDEERSDEGGGDEESSDEGSGDEESSDEVIGEEAEEVKDGDGSGDNSPSVLAAYLESLRERNWVLKNDWEKHTRARKKRAKRP